MKKVFVLLVILLSAVLFTTSASAHSGCCSYHDGVRADGCGCNDGTPLSSTCAPYYSCSAPQQTNTTSNNTTTNTYVPPVYVPPTDTPTPIPTSTPTPTLTMTPTPTPKPHKSVVMKNAKKKVVTPKLTTTPQPKSWWQWVFGW